MAQKDESKTFVEDLTDQADDFSRWYNDVIYKAELVGDSPVRGSLVIRPYGFGVWENIQRLLDRRIKATGHQNAYFPLLIPESLLQKEADHVEGFAPECAWVTEGGREKLGERYAIRPTSEAIIGHMYSQWIKSHRDLPVLLNQWCNVMRWEKRTRPFLRTAEFLWQEGHTAHASEPEAREEVLRMLEVYREFVETELAVPVHPGKKSDAERFAGAQETYTIEALMKDGKALQAGTSHHLGQHFAKVFDILYQDHEGKQQHVWQTSWGVSTRLIGALVMVHGDDAGLRLPPAVATIQVVVVPIWRKDEERAAVQAFLDKVREALGDRVRLHVDDRDQYSPGWKYNEYEMRGVPLRIEVGPKDVAKGAVMTVRRDDRTKESVPLESLAERVPALLADIQRSLYQQALAHRSANTTLATSKDEVIAHFAADRRGFVAVPWDGSAEFEAEVKQRTGATLRCMPFDTTPYESVARAGHRIALFARSY